MNPYKQHQLRQSFGISWREEYVLGVLATYGDSKTSFINHIAQSECIYKWDNAKNAIDKLADLGFVLKEKLDGRTNIIKLAHQGNVYLTYLKELYN